MGHHVHMYNTTITVFDRTREYPEPSAHLQRTTQLLWEVFFSAQLLIIINVICKKDLLVGTHLTK